MAFSQTLYALSDPTRRKVLTLLKKKDLAVADILTHLDITGASLSHHLAVLKQADLVSARRQGQQIIYSLNLSVFEELLNDLTKFIK
jgi:DNA-binding transcriptional ArsR family regulator